MEGKTATSLKGKISPESRLRRIAGQSTAKGDGAKTTAKARQSGTVHSTVHTVHRSKGWRTRWAATAHLSVYLSNRTLPQLLWSSGLPWVKYRLLMIVLQGRNLFERTIFTKGGKKTTTGKWSHWIRCSFLWWRNDKASVILLFSLTTWIWSCSSVRPWLERCMTPKSHGLAKRLQAVQRLWHFILIPNKAGDFIKC